MKLLYLVISEGLDRKCDDMQKQEEHQLNMENIYLAENAWYKHKYVSTLKTELWSQLPLCCWGGIWNLVPWRCWRVVSILFLSGALLPSSHTSAERWGARGVGGGRRCTGVSCPLGSPQGLSPWCLLLLPFGEAGVFRGQCLSLFLKSYSQLLKYLWLIWEYKGPG